MSTHNTTTTMSERESATFRDKFALHLAVELLGPDSVIEYLDGNDNRVPLYWRSKLMVSDPSRILFHVGENTDSKSTSMLKSTDVHTPKVLFFDVTFNFSKIQQQQQQQQEGNCNNWDDSSSTLQQSTSSVSVTFGFFLLLPKARREFPSDENKGNDIGGGHYISTRPLDNSQLISHVDSLQLDPQSVTAKALARSMAGEFLRQGPPSTNNEIERTDRTEYLTAKYVNSSTIHKSIRIEENGDQKSTHVTSTESQSVNFPPTDVDLRVDVPYKSIGNANGTFLLKYSAEGGVTKYSISSLRFLYWDFSKNTNHCHPLQKNDESIIQTKQLVEEAFDRWRTQIVPVTNSSDRKHTVDDNNNNARKPQLKDSVGNVLPPATVNSSGTSNNNKKRKVFKGASILPSARRKRNRGLVYDKK
uniref:Uncharacterized protein n=1 Tax=Pseudo-nitzschia australis TaxID=44445 RepID=A0A6U9XED3_9STRA|mmetsp:Transcript_3767/g.8108  ORF Transcript_3767/g.8108 Transcript_3767/m.8108 type:complete len:417 (-) Transcript_3767:1547-2797(-)